MSGSPRNAETTASDRDERIMQYYTYVDEYDTDSLGSVFTEDISFEGMGDSETGRDDVVAWYARNMTLDELYHDVERKRHAGDVSYAEGEFGGKLPNGQQVTGSFLNTFEFDEETTEITDLKVYTTLQPSF